MSYVNMVAFQKMCQYAALLSHGKRYFITHNFMFAKTLLITY